MFDADKPQDAARFVLMFLPGFVVLGGVSYFTDQTQSEFAFIYSSIALSLGIYFISSALNRRLWSGSLAVSGGRFFTSVCLVSTVVFGLIVVVVDSEIVLQSTRSLGLRAEKQSTRGLLPFYFNHDHNGQSSSLDKRPTAMWHRCTGDRRKCSEYRFDIYVRVAAEDAVFEGRVERYTMGSPDGLPFILSPACRVMKNTAAPVSVATPAWAPASSVAGETLEVVPGPGVVIFSEGLKYVELREMCASGCYRLINPTEKCLEPGSK